MSKTKRIEVIARGLIQQGRWVLLCRDIEHGHYFLPGGHVEPGEASATALERELVEEAGMQARAGECLLVCEQRFVQQGKPRHEINLVFHVEPPHSPTSPGDPSTDEDVPPAVDSLEEQIEFEWVEIAALGDMNLLPAVIRAWVVSGGALSDTNRPGWISIRE